jgi:hypothetical protein
MFPFVKSIVTPLLGTLWAVKLALNHMKLPAGTEVPLKFDGLFAVATHGGGVTMGQVALLGEKLMGTIDMELVNSADPVKVHMPVSGAPGHIPDAVSVAVLPLAVNMMLAETVVGTPLQVAVTL